MRRNMAKLIFACLIYIIAAAFTSCSASRSLLITALPSSDQTDSATVTARSATTDMVSTESTTSLAKMESDNTVFEHEGTLTKSDSEEFVHDLGPCMEDHDESSSASERPCHRILDDYGSPGTNVNYKNP